MVVFPYSNCYLGLIAIYNNQTDRVHSELAVSVDSRQWIRIDPGTPIIPPGEKSGDYDWGCIYCANQPIIIQNQLWLYYLGSNGLHTDWRKGFFCVAMLRMDGFAGYCPIDPQKESYLVTNYLSDLPFDWCDLILNADVEKLGFIEVHIIDEQMRILYSSNRITTTCIETSIIHRNLLRKLKNIGNNENNIAQKIQIQFNFKKAKIYSFKFLEQE
jgi:hypothetical protein